jgi:hypothetical protein
MTNPHTDHAGWGVRLRDALGTCSDAFLDGELRRIATFLRDSDGNIHPQEVDAYFAVLDGAKPENEMQAMLVIQIRPLTRSRCEQQEGLAVVRKSPSKIPTRSRSADYSAISPYS